MLSFSCADAGRKAGGDVDRRAGKQTCSRRADRQIGGQASTTVATSPKKYSYEEKAAERRADVTSSHLKLRDRRQLMPIKVHVTQKNPSPHTCSESKSKMQSSLECCDLPMLGSDSQGGSSPKLETGPAGPELELRGPDHWRQGPEQDSRGPKH